MNHLLVQHQCINNMAAAATEFQYVCCQKTTVQCKFCACEAAVILFMHWSCTRRWFIDHANQTSICLDPHQNEGWYRETSSSPPEIFLLTAQRQCFFCGLILLFVFVILLCLSLAALGSPVRKGLTAWLSCMWCFLVVVFVTFPNDVLSQVRCGTWLYKFLIFAFFLELSHEKLFERKSDPVSDGLMLF